jgi:hypothetical protein
MITGRIECGVCETVEEEQVVARFATGDGHIAATCEGQIEILFQKAVEVRRREPATFTIRLWRNVETEGIKFLCRGKGQSAVNCGAR